MPHFEFECNDCGHAFFVRLSLDEPDQLRHARCPNCGGKKVEQTIERLPVELSKKS